MRLSMLAPKKGGLLILALTFLLMAVQQRAYSQCSGDAFSGGYISPTDVCVGGSPRIYMVIDGSNLGNGTYNFTYNLSGANSSTGNVVSVTISGGGSAGSYIPSSLLTNSGSTTITVTQISNGSGCTLTSFPSGRNSDMFNVVAQPNVAGMSVTASNPCKGSGTTAHITSSLSNLPGGDQYQVYYSISGANSTSNSNYMSTSSGSGSFTTSALSNSGSNTISINSIIISGPFSGCNLQSVSGVYATFSVNPLPSVTTSSSTSSCSGIAAGIALTASTSGASTFTWATGTNTGSITGQNACSSGCGTTINDILVDPSSLSSGSVQYIVTPHSAAGCSGSATTITNTVNVPPSVSAGSNVSICSSSSATLTATGGSTYTWSPSTGLSATTGATVSASPSSTTTYTVTGTGASGCSATASVTVTSTPSPSFNISSLGTGGSYSAIGYGTLVSITSATLAPATYVVTYNLSVPNAATGQTASMVFAGGTGTFTTLPLSATGTTTITITGIDSSPPTGCPLTVTTGNSAAYTVNSAPAGAAGPCVCH